MKTSELIGPALDWAVAAANIEVYEGYRVEDDGLLHAKFCGVWLSHSYNPSTDWSQGGPIIERESIEVTPCEDMESWASAVVFRQGVETQYGPTPLIAAMRCYVASRVGDEIEIPEELL